MTYDPTNALLDSNNNNITMQRSIAIVQTDQHNVQLIIASQIVDIRLFKVLFIYMQMTLKQILSINSTSTINLDQLFRIESTFDSFCIHIWHEKVLL